MPRTGRPSLISDEILEQIIASLKAGAYIETAAAFAGISKQTLYSWLKRGARATRGRGKRGEVSPRDRPYADFLDAVKKAQAQGEMSHILNINSAAKGDPKTGAGRNWTASAWILERMYPHKYGRFERQPTEEVEAVLKSKGLKIRIVRSPQPPPEAYARAPEAQEYVERTKPPDSAEDAEPYLCE